jgi:acyl-coenzyme A thioesterase PaaI-like protein
LKPTDLALNQALGLREAPTGAAHLLEMPFDTIHRNHLGTAHAVAQFGLAEAASAECLLREFPGLSDTVVAVMRESRVKYRQAGRGPLRAFGVVSVETRATLPSQFEKSGRAFADVEITLKDEAEATTFHGTFTWFITRRERVAQVP